MSAEVISHQSSAVRRCRSPRASVPLCLCAFVPLCLCVSVPSLPAAERQGAYIAEIEDEDADQVIVMETDWISMRLMPAIGSTVARFVFRPTQNEICDITQPKNLKAGGGLLQDNVWEQDWRFQELRGKWYDYAITKRGPEEVQVVFETQLEGWLESKDSGLKSKLLENLRIRRTVTLRQGTPYFLFDVEFINPDRYAKLPLYWCHNSSRINLTAPDHVIRPSDLGINTIPGKTGKEYVYNFSHGWTARVSPERKEGVVYLMDYDYLSFLYNCSVTTTEWVYDNLLILNGRPVKTRIYILPTMGLEKVDHATEYFIVQVRPVREKDHLRLQYKVVASYEKARKVTFIPELEYDLLAPETRRETLSAISFTELGIEPATADVVFDKPCSDPLRIRTTAFVDLADGRQVKQEFELFHVGDYSLGDNVRKDLRTPVARLERRKQQPFLPVPHADMKVNREGFNVFALLGNHSRVLHVEEAIRSIRQDVDLQPGYHPGFIVNRTGLTDFPYDYDRLFNFRVVVLNNALFDPARYVGLHILHNYLARGGGLVFGGGENLFGLTSYDDKHPIYDYIPFRDGTVIEKGAVQLNSPVSDHPIFTGIDLSQLPFEYYVQKLEFKSDLPVKPRVLLKAGDQPFIVEYNPFEGQRTMLVLGMPYGVKSEHPGKTAFFDWPQWQKLYANVVRYAGHDL